MARVFKIEGKNYVFNPTAFHDELVRYSENKSEELSRRYSKREAMEQIAKDCFCETTTVEGWQKNKPKSGPASIEVIESVANTLGIEKFKLLFEKTEQKTVDVPSLSVNNLSEKSILSSIYQLFIQTGEYYGKTAGDGLDKPYDTKDPLQVEAYKKNQIDSIKKMVAQYSVFLSKETKSQLYVLIDELSTYLEDGEIPPRWELTNLGFTFVSADFAGQSIESLKEDMDWDPTVGDRYYEYCWEMTKYTPTENGAYYFHKTAVTAENLLERNRQIADEDFRARKAIQLKAIQKVEKEMEMPLKTRQSAQMGEVEWVSKLVEYGTSFGLNLSETNSLENLKKQLEAEKSSQEEFYFPRGEMAREVDPLDIFMMEYTDLMSMLFASEFPGLVQP